MKRFFIEILHEETIPTENLLALTGGAGASECGNDAACNVLVECGGLADCPRLEYCGSYNP